MVKSTSGRQKALLQYLWKNEAYKIDDDEVFVDITLHRVPGSLVREFAQKIANNYRGGLSEALQDLMVNAIREKD